MKRFFFLLIFIFVIIFISETALAQDKSKETQNQKQSSGQSKRVYQTGKIDVNELSDSTEQRRRREERLKRRQERQEIRQIQRMEKPKSKQDANEPGKPEKAKAVEKKTKDDEKHEQQLQAFEDKLIHEEAKHRKRKARLERIRELATESDDTKTVERVKKLLAKEQRRHTQKLQRMGQNKQKVFELSKKNAERQIKKASEKKE